MLFLEQISAVFLVYQIPFYPFESFEGRRILSWNMWIYGIMAAVSAGMIAWSLLIQTGFLSIEGRKVPPGRFACFISIDRAAIK